MQNINMYIQTKQIKRSNDGITLSPLKNNNERRDDPDVSDYLGLFIASVVYE